MVTRHVVTMANCIVGVSVLAMPFCFKQCGVVLASILLFLGGLMTRTVCYFLLKASTITRRRTYELLAFHTFGPAGKLMVEISIIGFLIGTLIAFLVVMGDLGPEIVSDMFVLENNSSLRTIIMAALSIFVALPLGLLRNIESLGNVSSVTMMFYLFLVCKILSEGMGPLWSGSFLTRINYWRPAGVPQCIPIFSMALSCQTQIFGVYESLPEPSLHKMNDVVKKAITACTVFYICVGFFGYIAFCQQNFTGNILLSFGPSWSTQLIKVCVVLSIAFSFPLVIFPCRASLHSLIFKRANLHHLLHDITTNYIPESRLKLLTVAIIAFTLTVSLLIPNIELVLGLVGSTTGSVICIIFPAMMFFQVTSKNTTERLLAQFIFTIGVIMMVVTTYATLFAVEQAQHVEPIIIEKPKLLETISIPAHPAEVQVELKIPNLQKQNVEQAEKDISVKLVPPETKNVEIRPQVDFVPLKPRKIISSKKPPEHQEISPLVDLKKPDDVQVQEEGVKVPPSPVVDKKPLVEGEPKFAVGDTLQKEEQVVNAEQASVKEKVDQKDLPLEDSNGAKVVSKAKASQNLTKTAENIAEDILLKLKEHETVQKKLVEQQQQILEQLKQHQEEEIKEKLRNLNDNPEQQEQEKKHQNPAENPESSKTSDLNPSDPERLTKLRNDTKPAVKSTLNSSSKKTEEVSSKLKDELPDSFPHVDEPVLKIITNVTLKNTNDVLKAKPPSAAVSSSKASPPPVKVSIADRDM